MWLNGSRCNKVAATNYLVAAPLPATRRFYRSYSCAGEARSHLVAACELLELFGPCSGGANLGISRDKRAEKARESSLAVEALLSDGESVACNKQTCEQWEQVCVCAQVTTWRFGSAETDWFVGLLRS